MADYNQDIERQTSPHNQNGEKTLGFEKEEHYDFCSYFLIGVSYLLVFITFPFTFFMYFRIVQQYERGKLEFNY